MNYITQVRIQGTNSEAFPIFFFFFLANQPPKFLLAFGFGISLMPPAMPVDHTIITFFLEYYKIL